MKKKTTTKKKTAKKTISLKLKLGEKTVKAVQKKIKRKIQVEAKEAGVAEINATNPYAPGTWGVKYIYDSSRNSVDPYFYKLSAAEIRKNKKKEIYLPHEETVEEALEKLKFKK